MSTPLSEIKLKEWRERARRGGYRVDVVARELGVSSRWLEKHFKEQFRVTPHEQFALWREERIRALAREDKPGKEIASEVGLSDPSSLNHTLSRAGLSLRQLKTRGHGKRP